ncbi:hypothetical protein FHX08_006268 [Rhizobium sp. BK529]|uniref:FCD domain-containing protein n=1 Tax=Rhizobium sp. BK529 TaxID=2586983 RepID=UPI001615DC09|nr:FCD domain-containing protein [Rhizobium sp. BK529]MBB3595851.1 hypothetical protein [Rhizobium sp. BK529]
MTDAPTATATSIPVLAKFREIRGCQHPPPPSQPIRTIRLRYGFPAARMDGIIAEHPAIIEAIAPRDVAAADQAARIHSLNSCDDMLKRYQGFASVEGQADQDA